jgi:hypothetical protein
MDSVPHTFHDGIRRVSFLLESFLAFRIVSTAAYVSLTSRHLGKSHLITYMHLNPRRLALHATYETTAGAPEAAAQDVIVPENAQLDPGGGVPREMLL